MSASLHWRRALPAAPPPLRCAPHWCLAERSARRSATVTSSVPLLISASRISSLDANFPVPTSRREVNSRSAIFSFEGLSAIPETITNLRTLANSQHVWGAQAASLPSLAACALRNRTCGIFHLYEAPNHATFPPMVQFD